MNSTNFNPVFRTISCCKISDELLQQCYDLYKCSYGYYDGKDGKHKAYQRIVFPKSEYETYRKNPDMYVSFCLNDGKLLGHAFYLKKQLPNEEICTWVTQLVVHFSYRKRGIGTRLLQSAWGFSNYFAWGLATANALTIKALETATWRQVDPMVIQQNMDVINALSSEISFAKDAEVQVVKNSSMINSHFFPIKEHQDYTNIYVKRLGALPDGYEWLAFTFRSQDMLLSDDHFEQMLNFSQAQLEDAYSRMQMSEQAWTKYTSKEIDYISNIIPFNENTKVLDLGCGQGRHSIELAKRGCEIKSYDSSALLIEGARDKAKGLLTKEQQELVKFECKDCRVNPTLMKFDLALCLYDVIGSYRNPNDNNALIDVLTSRLRVGGYAVVSVMNMELTKHIAIHIGSPKENPSMLLKLPASNIMQKTGDVFDPNYYLLDTQNHLVYRKEQFEQDGLLSSEYVIADYRYTMQELIEAFESRGMEIIDKRYVRAGYWDAPLSATDNKAKEILLIMRKTEHLDSNSPEDI